MTAQTREMLVLDGQLEELRACPLDSYLDTRGINMRERSPGYTTGLYRGYVGYWELVDSQLYLIGLFDFMMEPFPIASVFGDHPLPIKADWFSGRLDVSRGEQLTYAHFGWGYGYSERLMLYIADGRLKSCRRYDDAKLLKRRFDANYRNHEEFRQEIKLRYSEPCGPLGGFTKAGLKAIGFADANDVPTWTDSNDDEDWRQWHEPTLKQCIRVSR